jgi:hypothetical protein
LPDNFPIQNSLKQGDALSQLPFSFSLEYSIKKVQENQVRLKPNGAHQLLTYADNVNLLDDNINTIKKITETLIDGSKEVGLEVNTEKTKFLSRRLLSKNIKIRIYETVILPFVLYGCEAWHLTLREKYGLRVFETMMLRRIFGPKGDEVPGDWRKLHNEELRDLYSLPSKIRMMKSRRMRWAGHVAYGILVRKPEGKKSL